MANRARDVALWLAPPALGLVLYWPGLMSWFQKDDFAWLGLRALVHNWHDLWWALFTPLAQGTIRPLSERAFYLGFTWLFGLNPLPFHLCVFLTYVVTTVVLASVCTKLTGSRMAGFWAAILWTVNGVLAVPLAWSPIYYEILCSLVLLASLWLLIRYDETGRSSFYWLQCAVFILGFGILELNVVYPALAAAYALCRAPRLLARVIPLFAISAANALWHLHAAPLSSTGVYKMYWDASILSTLWTYWLYALGPRRLMLIGMYSSTWRTLATALLMAGLFVFLGWKLRRREWVAALFPAWFLIVLSPLLPLRDHISDYYLTIPLIGLAMWGGWALAAGWNAGLAGKIVAVSLLSIYVSVSIPVGRATAVSFYNRSQDIRRMLESIVRQSRGQPGKTILLTGVAPDMFWSALYHRPLRLYGIDDVHLMSGHPGIAIPEWQNEETRNLFITPAMAEQALRENRAVVYDLASGVARDVTAEYAPLPRVEVPGR